MTTQGKPAFLAAAILLSLVIGTSPANAASTSSESDISAIDLHPATVIYSGDLVLDCDSMSPKAWEYARVNEIPICGLQESDGVSSA